MVLFLIPVIAVISIWVLLIRPYYVSQQSYNSNISVNPDKLKKHVRVLSQDLLPRNGHHPQSLQRSAQYIENQLRQTTSNVALQTFEVYENSYHNVIATYGPETAETIVVGAHYDAYDVFPGADDNASAVAGLIELGRLLSNSSLNYRVELVAYTLEEPPFFTTEHMGSAVHAKSLRESNRPIKLMIALEMIGYFSDTPGSQEYPLKPLHLFYPSRGNFIAIIDQLFSNNATGIKAAINKYTDLPAYSFNAPSFVPGIDLSDHRNFWEAGYPAVMITDTAFFRNHAYHTPQDTYDRLDYDKMARVVYGLFKYLQGLE